MLYPRQSGIGNQTIFYNALYWRVREATELLWKARTSGVCLELKGRGLMGGFRGLKTSSIHKASGPPIRSLPLSSRQRSYGRSGGLMDGRGLGDGSRCLVAADALRAQHHAASPIKLYKLFLCRICQNSKHKSFVPEIGNIVCIPQEYDNNNNIRKI